MRAAFFVGLSFASLFSISEQGVFGEEAKPTAVVMEGKNAGQPRELAPGIQFRWCPPGSYSMGDPGSALVSVTISSGFWLGETEVTQGQWKSVMETTPWKGKKDSRIGADLPATYIARENQSELVKEANSCVIFFQKLNERERELGRLPKDWVYTLPTEAQWEYACRAGTKTIYSFGDDPQKLGQYAWTSANVKQPWFPQRVGTRAPNPWGLRDMHGNVNELCIDRYNFSDRKLPGGVDPVVAGDDSGKVRYYVIRGGDCRDGRSEVQSSSRSGLESNQSTARTGFRMACVRATVPENPNQHFFHGRDAGERKELIKGFAFRWCPAGEFLMGSPLDELGRESDERQVSVKISKGFWMAETELTQHQWHLLMEDSPWREKQDVRSGSNYPACYINYPRAIDFCEKLTVRERASGAIPAGWAISIPTESQWEYACRAGSSTRFSFGDDARQLNDYGWWGGHPGKGSDAQLSFAQPVGLKKANPWGLFDVHGNVWEWCLDSYQEKAPGGRNPRVEIKQAECVARGGDWVNIAENCRSANRDKFPREYKVGIVGIRLVCVSTDE